MGIYLNPGYQVFEEAIQSDIFVDKTEMIRYVNSVVKTKRKYLSVSRPRRFGKTMAADMLCAYYERSADSRFLFEKTLLGKRDGWDAYLGKYDVIRIVMTDFIKKDVSVENSLKLLTQRVLDDLCEVYPEVKYDPNDLAYSMNKFYHKSQTAFVIVIDEWDAVFRVRKEDKDGQTKYLDFLRDWLKDKEFIALAYMTGILPIKKYGQHSALNMFDEYSMIQPMQLAPYTGFTEKEVEELCTKYEMSYEEIARWYDGYIVSEQIPVEKRELYRQGGYHGHQLAVYSPLSVVMAMTTGQMRNYWNKTETYEALAEYIRLDFDGLKNAVALLMDGVRIKVDLGNYQNDMTTFHSRDDVLALLIHLGYLGYDDEQDEVFIPNKEILDEFRASTKSDEWVPVMQAFQLSQELVKATWACDEKKVEKLLEQAHDRADNKTYNSEAALSYALQLAYYAAQKYYTTVRELDTGKGYADIVYLPSPKCPEKPVLLIELKYEKNVETALDQIRRREYPAALEHYKGNILLVGVSYEKDAAVNGGEYKRHSCRIEKA